MPLVATPFAPFLLVAELLKMLTISFIFGEPKQNIKNGPNTDGQFGMAPLVATPLKGRFVVFLKWLWMGYFRLGYCPTGLGNWPLKVRAPRRGWK